MLKLIAMSCLALSLSAGLSRAGQTEDVIAAARHYYTALNAHDLETAGAMLVDAEDLLLVRGPSVTWGKQAVLAQYETAFKGVWRMTTEESAPKVMVVNDTVAETFIPVTFEVGPKEGETKLFTLNVKQVWVKQDDWKLRTILATPVAPPK